MRCLMDGVLNGIHLTLPSIVLTLIVSLSSLYLTNKEHKLNKDHNLTKSNQNVPNEST